MAPILYIGLSQTAFAAFVVVTKKSKVLSDVILAIWLLLISIEMGLSLYGEVVKFSNLFLNLEILIPLTYMPFMYLYVKNLISETPAVKSSELLHFFPFICFLILILFFLGNLPIFYGEPEKWYFYVRSFRIVYGIYFLFSLFFYSFYVLKLIHEHQEKIEERFSYTSQSLTLNWLKFILLLFLIAFTGMFMAASFTDQGSYPFDPRYFTRIGMTVFAFGVSYFGVKQPALFKRLDEDEIKSSENLQKIKYEKSGLNSKQAREYVKKLKDYMNSDKPYLNSELTINNVANHLNINRHHLTQVLNEHIQKNFYHFINDYRIREVKNRLLDEKHSHLTLLAIAYDCGFNSKSAFNAIFKKATGMTPSEYRNVQT